MYVKINIFFRTLLTGLIIAGLLAGCGQETSTSPAVDSGQVVNVPPGPTFTTEPTGKSASNTAGASAPAPASTPTLKATEVPTATPVPTPTPYPAPALKIPLEGTPKPVDFTGSGQETEAEFNSKLLNQTVPYRIYLPQEYATGQKRYPVLYLLHGYSGKVEEWTWYGLFESYEALLNLGAVKPFIIVLAYGAQEYWMDHPNNGAQWGEYVAREVVDHIDGNYRTIPLKESRAIGGLSMGGNGALQITMNYPNIFGVVGAHSPTMRTYEQKLPWWGDEEWFQSHDPISLAKTNQYITQVKLWVDIGTDDKTWRPRALELKQVLQDRKLNFTWTDFPGDHVADYWKANTPAYLRWYSSQLNFK